MAEVDTFGPYKAEKQLASGGQAQVWLAKGPKGEVALKVARTDAQREALAREARALTHLGVHPGLVRFIDAAPDFTWIALERVFGLPLDKWATHETPIDVAAAIGRLADVVAAVHEKGVIHGDIKPANVLVDVEGDVKLLDFGCAVIGDDAPKGFRGTPGFAAPELLRGERAQIATDYYGLGGSAYACVTGRPPFVAADAAAQAYLPMVDLPEPPGALVPGIPALFSQLIMGLLARDAARRPVDAAKLKDWLARVPQSPPGTPIVGMRNERDILRRAVVGAVDGECRVVVVYGPAGSGRKTLITEAAEAGRREGLPLLSGDLKEFPAQMKKTRRASILALRSSQAGAVDLAKSLLDSSTPALVLIHADRPLPALGNKAVHITPPPLTKDEAELLFTSLEGDEADLSDVEAWCRETFGHPVSLLARWRLARDKRDESALPQASRRVLQAVRKNGETRVCDLAEALKMGEHDLLDHCEVLFAEGWLTATQKGTALLAS